MEGGWKPGTGAVGECIRGVIALLIFVCPCVTPPDAYSPQYTHTQRHAQPINPTGPIESSVPLKAFRAPVFYTLNIIMHRGVWAHWCPTAVIERQGMGRGSHGAPSSVCFPKGCSIGLFVHDFCLILQYCQSCKFRNCVCLCRSFLRLFIS